MAQIHQPDQDRFRTVPPEDIEWRPFAAHPPANRLAILVGDPRSHAKESGTPATHKAA
jgi:hypothetical protein